MCPQAEGRLRGEVDEVRGYHKGARRVEKSLRLFRSRWQAFIRRALPQRIAYDIRYALEREGLAASCDRFLDLGLSLFVFSRGVPPPVPL